MDVTEPPTSFNITVLRGTLHRPAQSRELASGDSVTTLDIKVRSGARAEIVRISWMNAPTHALEIEEGDDLVVTGRVRAYWSGRRSETDVLATSVARAKSYRQVRKHVAASMAALQAACP
jgi:hypothetical protein